MAHLPALGDGNMSNYKPGGLYFQAGPDWNYLKYLETKSHFDALQLSVSSDIRKLAVSDEYLANKGIRQLDGSAGRIAASVDRQTEVIGAKLDHGFELLSVGLGEVKTSIDELSAVCETGFSEIALELGGISGSLDELIRLAKTPDQTWAFEQFEIAKTAFERCLFEEALDYASRAIDGHGAQSGYRLESSFHYLRGLIHLGSERNFHPSIVDPRRAMDDFLSAARYAEKVDRDRHSKSLQMAGWAAYCAGELTAAKDHLKASLKVERKDPETNFLMAKVFMNLAELDDAGKFYSTSLRTDIGYALRAANDPDFIDYQDRLISWFEQYRDELVVKCASYLAPSSIQRVENFIPLLVKHDMGPTRETLTVLKKTAFDLENETIDVLVEAEDDISSSLRAIELAREGLVEKLTSRAEELRRATSGKVIDLDYKPSQEKFGIIGAIAVTALVVISEGISFFGIAVGVVGGALGGAALTTPLEPLLRSIHESRKTSDYQARNREDLAEVEHDIRALHAAQTS